MKFKPEFLNKTMKHTILSTFFICTFLSFSSYAAQNDLSVYASGLGDVYGIGFDSKGNLYATGTDKEKVVLWKIAKDGNKSIFSELDDNVDAMGSIGIANHSKKVTNITVDGQDNIWITSSRHGACFIITNTGTMFKVYLNKEYSLSMEDIAVPSGVAWDGKTGNLYLITSGPAERNSTTNIHHIATLSDCADSYAGSMFAGKNKSVRFVNNTGITIKENAVALIKDSNSPLYLLAPSSLYEVQFGGSLKAIGQPFTDIKPFSGVIANGAIYISAENSKGSGFIDKIDKNGKRSSFIKSIAKPRGLACMDGFLYVVDKEKGSILKTSLK